MFKKAFFILAAFIGLSCMWDNDTLQMEMKQYPGTIDLITGNFLRHSPEFHYWRIQDRTEKLKKEPMNLAFLDDMAVSHSKLGADSVAIQIMHTSLAVDSNRYETLANLGTFYIHNKQLEKGKQYIEKAIAVNPDAHFGREIIQLKLVEYILNQRTKGIKGLPLSTRMPVWEHGRYRENKARASNFYTFIKSEGIGEKQAFEGIQGMMRFGNYDSPVLLEVLADLLVGENTGRGQEPLHLVRIALTQAAIGSDNKTLYNKKIELALEAMPESRRFRDKGLDDFKEELEKAEANFSKLRANEITWILNGQNPEVEYKKHYYDNDSTDRLSFEIEGSEAYQNLPKDTISQNFKDQLKEIMTPVVIQTDTKTTKTSKESTIETPKAEGKKTAWMWILLVGLIGLVSIILLFKKKS